MKLEQRLKLINEGQNKVRQLALEIVDSDPWVSMKLGGKSYKFELSMGAVEDVFRQTALTIGLDRITTQIIAQHLPVLMLAGLRTHHSDEFGVLGTGNEEESQRAMMRRLPIMHMNYYITVVEQALHATEPDPEQVANIMSSVRETMKDADEEDAASPLGVGSTSELSGLSVVASDSPETKSDE